MRKILAVLLAVVLVLPTLAACDLGGAPEDNVPPAHEHTVVIDDAVAPTCTSTGLTAGAHCSECGEITIKQEIIPVSTEHTYDDEYDAVCNVCGHTREVDCAHTTLETLPAKEATCKESGLTEGKKCSDCGDILVKQEIIPVSIEHAYDDEYDAVCNVCGYTREVSCAHATLETLPAKDATCKESGLTEGKKCSDCGEILVEQQILPVTEDHSFVDRVCEICGELKDSEGFAYAVIDNNTCYIIEIGNCTDLDIKIPEYIDGYKVTSIDNFAFYGCSSLTSIVIPDNVTSIGAGAFEGCSSLTSIVIPGSVMSIGSFAFYGCSSLTSIVIPDSVTSIGDYTFAGCSSLTSVKLPDSAMSIGDVAFRYCSSLTSVKLPDSVTSIGESAFAGCSSLTSIVIPDSVMSIGDEAFHGCSSLESIAVEQGNIVYHGAGNCLIETASKILIAGCKNSVIPTDGSVTSIGDYALYGCSSLTSIEIPDSVTSIGVGAFRNCSSLTSIVIPDSVTSIGDGAFLGCSSLASIVLHDSVTSIGGGAFRYCSSLTSIVIPDSVTSIGDGAFGDCSSLTSIEFEGTKAQWNAISKGFKWNINTGNYTVHCADGDITKSNS